MTPYALSEMETSFAYNDGPVSESSGLALWFLMLYQLSIYFFFYKQTSKRQSCVCLIPNPRYLSLLTFYFLLR